MALDVSMPMRVTWTAPVLVSDNPILAPRCRGVALAAGLSTGQLIGGSGSDTFVGGGGNATITAGSGSDVYAFINHQAGGNDVVQGIFDPASIQIHLQGSDPSTIKNALASQRTTNGSVTIGLEDGTKITFQDLSSLNRSNYT
jgi:hypothetical protein